MEQYQNMIRTIMTRGRKRVTSVQGPGTIVYTGFQARFEPEDGFPLITVRSLKGSWKALVHELLWFLSGSTNAYDLHKYGVHLWDQWATPETAGKFGHFNGELGPIYGAQWRTWKTADGRMIDQISNLIVEIKNYPDSKRMMVDTWNPGDVFRVFIAPCHGTPIKAVVAEGIIDLFMAQRSADTLLGVPFNIASYSLLHRMLAQVTGLKLGTLVIDFIDAHIYQDQISYVEEILCRKPRQLPQVKLNPDVKGIFNFRFEDFTLEGYNPHPPIKDIPVGI
jgi:thymidylate synthase